MSRRVVIEERELEKEKLRELKSPELKYLQEQVTKYYEIHPRVYNFLIRNDDRDLPGRLRKNVQSIVVMYSLREDYDNYYNLTIDIDFDKVYYLEDILKRIILEIDNSLVKKEEKIYPFQYKFYKEPLLIGKKFITEEDKVNVFYNSVNPKSYKQT